MTREDAKLEFKLIEAWLLDQDEETCQDVFSAVRTLSGYQLVAKNGRLTISKSKVGGVKGLGWHNALRTVYWLGRLLYEFK